MAEVLERTEYAAGASDAPTLRLHALRDTDSYWRPQARLRAATTLPGVLSGFEISAAVGATGVTVGPGTAVDPRGELISVAAGGVVLVDGADRVVEEYGVEIPLPSGPGDLLLVVTHHEGPDTEHPAALRIRHTPVLALVDPEGPDLDTAVVLARVGVDDAGAVTELGRSTRAPAGLSVSTVRLRRAVADTGPQVAVRERAVAAVTTVGDGLGLRVGDDPAQLVVGATTLEARVPVSLAADLTIAGALAGTSLRLTGTARAARLDADDATVETVTAASLTATSLNAIALTADALTAGSVSTPSLTGTAVAAGSLTVSGAARLGGLRVDGEVDAASLSVTGELRAARDVTLPRGLVRFGSTDPVPVGRITGALGFAGFPFQHGQLSFRVGHGFEMVDRSADFADLDHARDSHPYADLTVRSLDARGGLDVHGSAQVRGSADVRGNLDVRGSLALPPAGTLRVPGRMHVHVDELLYLLAGQGAVVSRAWGGNGNLTVEGDVFLGTGDAVVYIGGNQNGRFMRLHDDLWFSDPQNGAIDILNAQGGPGRMRGMFSAPCSRTLKHDVEALAGPGLDALLDDLLRTEVVRFRYRGEEGRTRLGVIAEDGPPDLVGPDRLDVAPVEYAAMLHGAVKVLAARLARLERSGPGARDGC